MMTATIASMGITQRRNKYHIWVIGTNGVKLYFCDTESIEGNWTEDICHLSESDDFRFVYDFMADMMNDKKLMEQLEASLLF
jgi:hypothetical protein